MRPLIVGQAPPCARRLGRNVVLLGRAVAAAFEFAQPSLEWCIFRGMFVAACPHPSGLNLWWYDQMNRERARTFWRQLVFAADHGGVVIRSAR